MSRVGYVGRTMKRYERAVYPTPTPNPWLEVKDISKKTSGYNYRTWGTRKPGHLTDIGAARVGAVSRANRKVIDAMMQRIFGTD